ncbi:universal stress protein [Mycobacterium sp. MS1601]|uniref:universal stress protein n=1 Tax=Mycobacterium sp. MS1601 TaxID=1936029 RepID=UPI0009797551|nr:universal stress protein [Mycobacterium sp. MS1601]AQA01732.1 universal stress protein [Mycobacterium sp. MS1601]
MDLLVGYDGSPAATTAIRVGTRLFPKARAQITFVQTPPFASPALRKRLRLTSRSVSELSEAVEREGKFEAQLIADTGVALATAGGWEAEALLKQAWGGEGIGLAQLAETTKPAAVVVGSRGLSGSEAMLGSVSELLVLHSPVPVLVTKQTLLATEYQALATGPVLVGVDGSAGAATAVAAAQALFPGREVVAVSVSDGSGAEATAADGVRVVTTAPSRGRGAGATADALIASADEHGAAALVVGSRGRTGLKRVLLGSVAKSLLHTTYRPVVVVPSS